MQGYIKFPRDTSKPGFGYASIAHEPAYPIKSGPNPPALAPAGLQQRLRKALVRGAGSLKARSAEA